VGDELSTATIVGLRPHNTYRTVIEVTLVEILLFFALVSITSFANSIRYILKYLLTFCGS
jgi:hypothetical protein